MAHCGGSASGQYCKTLTGTAVGTGWTELRPLLNAANLWVKAAFEDILAGLPFGMTGAHYDNGMEFVNWPLFTWCKENGIEVTRTRPYRKNDNCQRHICRAEQKNYDAERKTVGYFRYDTQAECAALGEVYRWLCLLHNYWMPSFQLESKEKQEDGRYKKVYEKTPKTPYERLLESPEVPAESKAELMRRRAAQNPVELNRRLNEAVAGPLKLNREKQYAGESSCQEGARACAV
ncbi:MAG: hypothetical protein FWG66_05475 [Spirochaetes bacterium]|nr:hypothetical protein [Spirochaetota bacterium]